MLCQLPFNEDLRPFYFSPLTTDKTQPSDDQLDTIDDLITTMDLMEAFVSVYKPFYLSYISISNLRMCCIYIHIFLIGAHLMYSFWW